MPTLSIVTITKDDPLGLARTLKSTELLRQQRVEHIVVDGSSGPAEGSFPSDVHWVHREPAGITDAFNHGLSLARGEWIWFVNGGDAVHECLDAEWFLHYLTSATSDIVVGAMQLDGEGSPRAMPGIGKRWPLWDNWLPHPATLVRRRLLLSSGGFDLRYRIAMDYDLWQRMMTQDSSVDVISMPFARFATGGISQRPENHLAVKKENAFALRRQFFRVVGDLASATWRGIHAFSRMIFWAIRQSR